MTAPKPCRYDPDLDERITRGEHDDDCPGSCTGCAVCPEPHCALCGRRHLDDQHPRTCDRCVGTVRDDLTEIRQLCAQLRDQALNAGVDGRLAAAARIPGRDAMVLIGPSTDPAAVLTGRHYADDHRIRDGRSSDPEPPLSVLAALEDRWRTWLDAAPGRRASIAGAVDYLDQHLTLVSQQTHPRSIDGQLVYPPDFAEFARTIADLRTQLERTLHDERLPDLGVDCFACGRRLVRRHRDPAACRCGPRPVLAHAEHGPCSCTTRLLIEQPSDPEHDPVTVRISARPAGDGHIHPRPDLSCVACHRETEWERRHAKHNQGGLSDPTAGIGWECPSCRHEYTPGEYVNAVRRDLVDTGEANGWADVVNAAQAASVIVGRYVPPATVRTWMHRGQVAVGCAWEPGRRSGRRMVAWLDVAELATASKGARTTTGGASWVA